MRRSKTQTILHLNYAWAVGEGRVRDIETSILGNWKEPIPGSKIENTGGQHVEKGRPWIPSGHT